MNVEATKTNNVTTNKTTKIIFKPRIARQLLKRGNQIVDIKPDRNNEGHTIFVFEISDKFKSDLDAILTETKDEVKGE